MTPASRRDDEKEVNQFLSHSAIKEKVSASTQNQALSALLFLYSGAHRRRERRKASSQFLQAELLLKPIRHVSGFLSIAR
jgi:Phage integrase, N-terminal SAM-like domain